MIFRRAQTYASVWNTAPSGLTGAICDKSRAKRACGPDTSYGAASLDAPLSLPIDTPLGVAHPLCNGPQQSMSSGSLGISLARSSRNWAPEPRGIEYMQQRELCCGAFPMGSLVWWGPCRLTMPVVTSGHTLPSMGEQVPRGWSHAQGQERLHLVRDLSRTMSPSHALTWHALVSAFSESLSQLPRNQLLHSHVPSPHSQQT